MFHPYFSFPDNFLWGQQDLDTPNGILQSV